MTICIARGIRGAQSSVASACFVTCPLDPRYFLSYHSGLAMASDANSQSLMRPKAWLAWSSGKDSAWALHVVRQAGDLRCGGAAHHGKPHAPARGDARRAGRACSKRRPRRLDCRSVKVPIPSPCSNEFYEQAMSEAMARAMAEGVRHVIFGDLFLEDIRAYREKHLAACGMAPVFPLWRRDTRQLAEEMIAGGLSCLS